MPEETPTIQFNYIKSNFFRVAHVDGVLGNITPAGLIFISFYNERAAIPQSMVHAITEAGQVGDECKEKRVTKEGIVREIELGAVMSIETATSFMKWLEEKIFIAKKLRSGAENVEEEGREKAKDGTLH
jgi:hypothetical protein